MAIICGFLYIPHIILANVCKKKNAIRKDVERNFSNFINLPYIFCLLFLLHNDRYFRSLFYYRIGPFFKLLIGWWRPGDRSFIISFTARIGEGVYCPHSYATIINADRIGRNFSCRHLTTIGNKIDGDNVNRPVIGDNVSLGANVTIIGNVHIGNNVTIGAGSVVVKSIPDNAIAVGNPAKVIKYIE